MKYSISFCYRSTPKPQTSWIIVSELLGGIMWWWIFWNFWYDYKHIIVSTTTIVYIIYCIYIYIYLRNLF